jgi:hypothetical protein
MTYVICHCILVIVGVMIHIELLLYCVNNKSCLVLSFVSRLCVCLFLYMFPSLTTVFYNWPPGCWVDRQVNKEYKFIGPNSK